VAEPAARPVPKACATRRRGARTARGHAGSGRAAHPTTPKESCDSRSPLAAACSRFVLTVMRSRERRRASALSCALGAIESKAITSPEVTR
jgi:hypothetical protein